MEILAINNFSGRLSTTEGRPMPDKKVWCVRGGTKDWSGHDLFLTEKVVALDEPFLPDLSQIPPTREMTKEWPSVPLAKAQLRRNRKMYGRIYDAVRQMDKPKDPSMNPNQLGQIVGHLVRLANVAEQDDLVIYPPDGKGNDTVYIGEIVSGYFYVACCFQHRRRVNWRGFSKGNLLDNFGPVKGFTEIKNQDQAGKIIRKWKRR